MPEGWTDTDEDGGLHEDQQDDDRTKIHHRLRLR